MAEGVQVVSPLLLYHTYQTHRADDPDADEDDIADAWDEERQVFIFAYICCQLIFDR